jgi:hypothetical protein
MQQEVPQTRAVNPRSLRSGFGPGSTDDRASRWPHSLRRCVVSLLAIVLATPFAQPVLSQEEGASDNAQLVLHAHEVDIRTADDITLHGTLSIPVVRNASKVPAVLLIQGSGPTDRDGNQPPNQMPDLLKKVAYTLAKGGVASLRFDKRGLGGNLPHQPDKLADFSRWENFVSDAVSAFSFLVARPEIDASRIAIFGHSEGGCWPLKSPIDCNGSPTGQLRLCSPQLRAALWTLCCGANLPPLASAKAAARQPRRLSLKLTAR